MYKENGGNQGFSLVASDDIEQAFTKAVTLHQRGELAPAESLPDPGERPASSRLPQPARIGCRPKRSQRTCRRADRQGHQPQRQGRGFSNNIGEAFRRLGDLDRAASHFTRAADLEPTFVEAQQNLGDVLAAQGKLGDAAAIYARVLSAKPDLAATHGRLGEVLRRQGKFDEALAHFRRAATIAGSAEAHKRLGLALREQDLVDKAIAQFRRALSLKKDFAQAANDL